MTVCKLDDGKPLLWLVEVYPQGREGPATQPKARLLPGSCVDVCALGMGERLPIKGGAMSIKSTPEGYLVDIHPQGREGKRIRKRFKTKSEAQQFDRWVIATEIR